MTENPNGRERWAKTRERGRQHYILTRGVLFWGGFTAVFWSLWMSWGQGWQQFLSMLSVALVCFPIGGYFWGAWMWSTMEKKYIASEQGDNGVGTASR